MTTAIAAQVRSASSGLSDGARAAIAVELVALDHNFAQFKSALTGADRQAWDERIFANRARIARLLFP